MILFNGLEDILRSVIANTSYFEHEDVAKETLGDIETRTVYIDPHTGKRYVSTDKHDDERLHNVMQALFGPIYPLIYKEAPSEFSYDDMLHIFSKVSNGKSLERSIRDIASTSVKPPTPSALPNDPGPEVDYEKRLQAAIWRVKKWFQDNWAQPITKRERKAAATMQEALGETAKHYEDQRQELLSALRKANWPI